VLIWVLARVTRLGFYSCIPSISDVEYSDNEMSATAAPLYTLSELLEVGTR